MSKLAILQSGFLSLTEESLVQTEPLQENKVIRLIELGKPVDAAGNAFFYNKDVEELFKLYNDDHRVMQTFAYREKLLTIVKSAFGHWSFCAWVDAQLKSPFLSAIHRKFLNDTFAFIATGQRNVNVRSWMGLISPVESTAIDNKVVLETDAYFGKKGQLPEKLSQLVCLWTGQQGGFTDLLYFLAIVFSKQTLSTV